MKHSSIVDAATIRTNAEKEIAEKLAIARIYEMLPGALESFNVFVCSTSFSADFHVKIEAKRYPFDSPRIDASIVGALAEMFPAIPLRKYKGSSTTILPVSRYEETKPRGFDEEMDIAPFVFYIDPANHSRTATLKWFALTVMGIIEFCIVFPLNQADWLGVSTVEYKKRRGYSTVERNTFTPNNNNVYTLFDGEETPIAELYPAINWASGSNETPGLKTLYWVPISETPVTLDAIISRIK